MKKRIVTVLLAAAAMAMVVTGCGNKEVKSVMGQIDGLGEITIESGDALAKIATEYEALSQEDKDAVENYSKYEDALKKYNNKMYKVLKEEIEKANKNASHVFANSYDMNKFNAAKTNAENALNNSQQDKYAEVYKELQAENKDLLAFIDDEMKTIFNVPTDVDPEGNYPFAVDRKYIEPDSSGFPLVKGNPNAPVDITISLALSETENPIANIFSDEGSPNYDYEIKNVETKEIKVQDKNKEIQTALVNTEFVATVQPLYGTCEEYELNHRPGYFLMDKEGDVYLAFPGHNNEDYYLLYKMELCTIEF